MKIRIVFFTTFLVFNNAGLASQEADIQKNSFVLMKAKHL